MAERAKQYWTVWTLEPPAFKGEEAKWTHWQSLDNRDDARTEAEYVARVHGWKAKIVRQDW